MSVDLKPLTNKQRIALEMAGCKNRLEPAPGLSSSSGVCGSLVRRGLLESTEQSELVRGERRVSYKLYRITEAGRALLQEALAGAPRPELHAQKKRRNGSG